MAVSAQSPLYIFINTCKPPNFIVTLLMWSALRFKSLSHRPHNAPWRLNHNLFVQVLCTNKPYVAPIMLFYFGKVHQLPFRFTFWDVLCGLAWPLLSQRLTWEVFLLSWKKRNNLNVNVHCAETNNFNLFAFYYKTSDGCWQLVELWYVSWRRFGNI